MLSFVSQGCFYTLYIYVLFQLGEAFFRFEVKRVCVSSVSLYARLTLFLYLSGHCNVLLVSSSFASVLVRN